jgi:hypothetical protein
MLDQRIQFVLYVTMQNPLEQKLLRSLSRQLPNLSGMTTGATNDHV